MKKSKSSCKILTQTIILAILFALSACVGDQSVAKRSGFVKDFSVNSSKVGCSDSYLVYASPYDTCISECETGFHVSTLDELSAVKKELVALGTANFDGVKADALLTRVNASKNICVADVIKDDRPTNVIDIKSDFCSCIAGKADIINNCDATCASKPVTDQAFLYVNTTVGPEIALNTKLGNIHNWCTVQLTNDTTNPQCSISATDGASTLLLPVTTSTGSNSFSVNVTTLAKNRTWILKLVESKAGSNAQSKEFQIRRKDQTSDTGTIGALKITPINQYTCMTYGGKVDAIGNIIRTTFARIFYYYAANEAPTPIAPAGGSNQSTVVCHDEQLHPGIDSVEYSRLELIPGAFTVWDKADTRFTAKAENGNVMTINKILQQRLSEEYQITANISLFSLLPAFNRPQTSASSSTPTYLGYYMIPFVDENGKAYCPTSTHFNGNVPLLNLLGEYLPDTEGIYFAEKEGETVLDGSTYKVIYGTMMVRESTLKTYGFYIENGLKIKADASSMNTKTIYYYWPTSTTADPLTQGGRRLFTVRTLSTLNGNTQSVPPTTDPTSDKRFGCIPKSAN